MSEKSGRNNLLGRFFVGVMITLTALAVVAVIVMAVDASAHQARTDETRKIADRNGQDIKQHEEQMGAIREALVEIKVTQKAIKETVERIDRRTHP